MSKVKKNQNKNSNKNVIGQLIVFQFFVFSIVGWIYEVLLNVYYRVPFENRGFLYGPYLPVYGVGGVLLILMLVKLMRRRIKVGVLPITPALVFGAIAVITTVLELFTGWAMDMIWHRRWWDYSESWLNFKGYICPLASFRFAIGGMVFLYFINPWLEKLFDKIPVKYQSWLTWAIVAGLLLDLGLTLLYRV